MSDDDYDPFYDLPEDERQRLIDARRCMIVPPISGSTESDAVDAVMQFSEDAPMFVPPRLYADLEKRGFLKDPEMAKRIRKTPTIPLA